jgi:hypothetical protein
MNDVVQINGVQYYGRLVKTGTRNHHPMAAYEGKHAIEVTKMPSDDSWTSFYVFESDLPLPSSYEPMWVHSLDYASFMDVDRDDCEAPGQLFRRTAHISRMTPRRLLITQSGGRDI